MLQTQRIEQILNAKAASAFAEFALAARRLGPEPSLGKVLTLREFDRS